MANTSLFLRTSLLLFGIVCCMAAGAQVQSVKLFRSQQPVSALLSKYVTKGSTFLVNASASKTLLTSRPKRFVLLLDFEGRSLQIILNETRLFGVRFFVNGAANEVLAYDTNASVHYKGYIAGDEKSFAAITIFRGRVVGVIADKKGNINIGPLGDNGGGPEPLHIIYREKDSKRLPKLSCAAESLGTSVNDLLPGPGNTNNNFSILNAEPLDIYFEADHSCYLNNNSSVSNTVDWIVALYNVVTTLYERDSIFTKISGIKVWNNPDPYVEFGSSASVLNAFSLKMKDGFPGDLAHLLTQRSLDGGIAFINVLCATAQYRTGISTNLLNSFNQLPAYSWSTMVITHELGHNIASNHTQWCGWPGGAIDNCAATEGDCTPGPPPVNGGTIMSYCHLTSDGINLMNGFGPLPGAVMRTAIENSTCIFPRVAFNISDQTVNEENVAELTECRSYKNYQVQLAINYNPSIAPIITLMPYGTSPGLEIGIDGDVSISPMSFTLTDSGAQIINVKVYDDAEIENPETLVLNYIIADNGSNAVKDGVYQMTIISGDHRPDSSVNKEIFFESFGANSSNGTWTQQVIEGNGSPNRWRIGQASNPDFGGAAAFISNNESTAGYYSYDDTDITITRFVSPAINANGFTAIKLNYLYKCVGEGTLSEDTHNTGIDFGSVYYSIDNGTNWFLLKNDIFGKNYKSLEQLVLPDDADNAATLRLAFQWQNNGTITNNPPLIIDSIVLSGTGITSIQSESHPANSMKANLGPLATVYFYNPVTKKIMASITNRSDFNFGCTTMEIIHTGDSVFAGWGPYAEQAIAEKCFKVTSQQISSTASYDISLYYTAAEVAGWAAATGNSVDSLVVVKTAGNILQSPPATLPEFGNLNNVSLYGVEADKIVTGSFSGFSTFSVGMPGTVSICNGSDYSFSALCPGLAYQWQIDSGSGYMNLNDEDFYSGAHSATLKITGASSSMYGYKYQCVVNTPQGFAFSPEYRLKFAAVWKGTVSNVWENPLNWQCEQLPDINTDVFVDSNHSNTPVVTANSSARTVQLSNNGKLTIKNAARLSVRH